MILKVFCVYDSAVKEFIQPFMMHHEGEAKRGFTQVVNDPSTKFFAYTKDYSLHQLGEFDSITGQYTNLTAPVMICTALSVKEIGKSHASDYQGGN